MNKITLLMLFVSMQTMLTAGTGRARDQVYFTVLIVGLLLLFLGIDRLTAFAKKMYRIYRLGKYLRGLNDKMREKEFYTPGELLYN